MLEYACRRIHGPITIDGVLDEPDWDRAEAVRDCGLLGQPEARSPLYFEFRALWDAEHLYVAFVSDKSPVPVTMSQRNDDLFNESAVELFVADDDGGYHEIEFNALGTILAFHCPKGADDADWRQLARDFNADIRVAVGWTPDGARWCAQASLPVADFPHATRRPWRVNFARSQRMPDGSFDLPTWAPAAGQFADVSAFGHLILME